MLFSIQCGSSRKVTVASWLFRADAIACCTSLSFEHVFIVVHWVADGEFSELCGECICSGTKISLEGGLFGTPETQG